MSDDTGTPSEAIDSSEMIDDETLPDELGAEDLSDELTDDEVELTDDEPNDDADADEDDGGEKRQPKRDTKTKEKAKPAKEKTSQKSTPREIGEDELDSIVTVKVNGETKKMTLREVTKLHSLEQASQRKMQEAAEERRKAQALIDFAKKNRAEFFKMIEVNQDELDNEAEERLARKYERAAMSDQERELHDLREDKQKRESVELESKQSLLDAIAEEAGETPPEEIKKLSPERLQSVLEQLKQRNQQTQTNLDEQIGTAWKDSGLPKHPRFVQLIAQVMRNHLHRTGESLQAKDAAAIVKRDFSVHVKEIVSQLDATAIRELLGDDTLTKLREADVERVTGRKPISHDSKKARPAQAAASNPRSQKTKEMSPYEAREYMARLKRDLRD